MSHPNPSHRDAPSVPAMRSPWFWLVTLIVPFVLFFSVLGVLSSIEKWHVVWSPPPKNAEIEGTGPAPWLPAERRADLKRKIERIDQEIPAIFGELKFLEGALKKEELRTEMRADLKLDPKEYVNFIRRQQKSLTDRVEILRADREFYAHELQEK